MTDPIRCRVCGKSVRVRADGTVGYHNDNSNSQCPGTGLPPAGDPPCLPSCRPVGTIGWPPEGTRRGEAHASTVVCDSPSHQDEARTWVHGITGHSGVFRSFADEGGLT
jgi:hypothetical protein